MIDMILSFLGFMSGLITPDKSYFKTSEFSCKCGCKENGVSPDFIEKLNTARYIAGIPFVISSGYRCPKHNFDVGGVPDSSHTNGSAVDIVCNKDSDRFKIIIGLLVAGFQRIGVSAEFIHADIDAKKGKKVIWIYR